MQLYVNNNPASSVAFVKAMELFSVKCSTSWKKFPWDWEWHINGSKVEEYVNRGHKVVNGNITTSLQTWLSNQSLVVKCTGFYNSGMSISRNVTVKLTGSY